MWHGSCSTACVMQPVAPLNLLQGLILPLSDKGGGQEVKGFLFEALLALLSGQKAPLPLFEEGTGSQSLSLPSPEGGQEVGDEEGPERLPFQEIVEEVSQRYGVPAPLVLAMIKVESDFNPDAVSPKGAMGLMQLMPETAKELGVKDPFDPRQNIDAGVRYLRELIERFDGDLKLALAAYNAGGGEVEKYHGVPPFKETREYVKKVIASLRDLLKEGELEEPMGLLRRGFHLALGPAPQKGEGPESSPRMMPILTTTLQYEEVAPLGEGHLPGQEEGSLRMISLTGRDEPPPADIPLPKREVPPLPLPHRLALTEEVPEGTSPISSVPRQDMAQDLRTKGEAYTPFQPLTPLPTPSLREEPGALPALSLFKPVIQEVVPQVIERVKVALKEGIQRIDFQWRPEGLGKLRVEISIRDKALSARITTADPLTKGVIEAHLPFLKEGLQSHGFRVGFFLVSLTSHGDYRWPSPSRPRREERWQRGGYVPEVKEETEPIPSLTTVREGGVDLRV